MYTNFLHSAAGVSFAGLENGTASRKSPKNSPKKSPPASVKPRVPVVQIATSDDEGGESELPYR